jgi:hypothetical protein
MKKLKLLLSFLTLSCFIITILSVSAGVTPYPAAKGLTNKQTLQS